MKKLILSAIISFVTLCSFGQVTLEHIYSTNEVIIQETPSGNLYLIIDNQSTTIYNKDHSIKSQIIYSNFNTSEYIISNKDYGLASRSFYQYDLKTNKIYFCISQATKEPYNDNNGQSYEEYLQRTLLINDNSNIVFSNLEELDSENNIELKTKGGKLIIINKDNKTTKIYPLNSSPNGTSTTQEKPSTNLKAYPNPSTASETTIPYELPPSSTFGEMKIYNSKGIEVDAFKIGKHFNSIKVNTSTYTNGTYICKVYANGTLTSAEKLVILK